MLIRIMKSVNFHDEKKRTLKNQNANAFAIACTITMYFSSDYRSNIAPSDSDRECQSRRDSDSNRHHVSGTYAPLHQTPRLGITAPSADSESGDGSHSPSPRASRRRTKIRNHSLTSLCLLSHHPFFSTFRECLFILKKLIDACNESASAKSVGASRQSPRYVLR